MVAVKDRTIPKTTSGKIRRKATKEALQLGTLWVLHDSMGILPPGKGKGLSALTSPTTPSSGGSNGSSRPPELSVRFLSFPPSHTTLDAFIRLPRAACERACAADKRESSSHRLIHPPTPRQQRSVSSSYLAGIGESIGGILGSLYDAIADPLSAYAGSPDAEIVAGPLSSSSGRVNKEPRAIEELDVDEAGNPPPPRVLVHSQSYHDKVRADRGRLMLLVGGPSC